MYTSRWVQLFVGQRLAETYVVGSAHPTEPTEPHNWLCKTGLTRCYQ
jgi:hypothetical protein